MTARLQRGEDTTMPGVGTWSVETDRQSGRIRVRFQEAAPDARSIETTLVSDVATELGMPPNEVAPRIEGFARAVQSHLNETGSVLLPGIGRLSGRRGRITFRPEPFFAEAIDWDAPAVAIADEFESDDPVADLSPGEQPPQDSWDVAIADEKDEAPAPDDVPSEIPAGPAPEPSQPAGNPPAATVRSAPRRPARRSRVMPLATAALVIVAATVAIVLIRGNRQDKPAQAAAVIDTTFSGLASAATVDSVLAADAPAAMDSTRVLSEQVAAEPEPVAEPVASPAQPAVAAPSQQDFDTTAEGYTLIVGSTVIEADAVEGIQRYRQLGLPAAVLSYVEDGSVRYRLAVGRYESAAVADQARQEMADRLPDGTWVRRIRP